MLKKVGVVERVASSPAGDNQSIYTKLKLKGFGNVVAVYHLPRINIGETVVIYSNGGSWKEVADCEGNIHPSKIEVLGQRDRVVFTWFDSHMAVNSYVDEK